MLRIRPAQPEDIGAVSALIRQLLPKCGASGAEMAPVFSTILASDHHACLVAVEDGRVIGLATLWMRPCLWGGGRMAFVDELVVDRDHRGRGIGSRLLEALEALAEALGCRRVELDTAPGREAAIAFYRSRGYTARALLLSKEVGNRRGNARRRGASTEENGKGPENGGIG